MPIYSEKSKERLATCDERLQYLFNEVIEHYDCTIIIGHRTEAEQNEAYRTGASTKQFPNSRHNTSPSLAVDVAPCPIDWKDTIRFYHFGGFVKGVAVRLGIPLRWGGDWDGDTDLHDQTLMDLVHFEIPRGH